MWLLATPVAVWRLVGWLHDERIQIESPPHPDKFLYRFRQGEPILAGKVDGRRRYTGADIDPNLSILAQRRDPEKFPEITHLAEAYERIRIYREWTFGRSAVVRIAQRTDLRTDRLEEDFSNLALFLQRLGRKPLRNRISTEWSQENDIPRNVAKHCGTL